jgi:uncharacterized repeat protein (TIGR03843 family)
MLDAKGSAPEGDRSEQAALDLLATGKLEVKGRLVDASNATLYCTINLGGREPKTAKGARNAKNAKNTKNTRNPGGPGGSRGYGPGGYGAAGPRGVAPPDIIACVYKPIAGERPLWDFPAGSLAGREVAAYAVSRAAGWDVVPPTVMRDGPFGPGMCQLWIDHDPEVDLIALSRRTDHAGLRDMAVFDAVVNNADRKIGHLLPVTDGHLYGCDHGVCFAEDYKLRTVLWQWRGKTLPRRSLDALRRLNVQLTEGSLAAELAGLLTAGEISATRGRIETLLEHRVHPYPPTDWPAVPWPPI